ncbi:MAG: 3'(2'),5'-bisphosphate nucleotidase CysQ [Leptospirales bacterium]
MSIKIEDIITLAREAGEAILEVYKRDFDVEIKDDKSPLTEADKKANEIIVAKLKELYPEIPILSEEEKAAAYETRKQWGTFWLVDPLDGTKEFIKKNGEFTVNIALIENHTPVLGVVFAPVLDKMYYGTTENGSWLSTEKAEPVKLPRITNDEKEKAMTVVASRSHMSEETEQFIEALKSKTASVNTISIGSSLKLCLVAEGEADVYPRLGPTMEWDTAAAHAVVVNAGKKVLVYENGATTETSLSYNKENLLNPFFVVTE